MSVVYLALFSIDINSSAVRSGSLLQFLLEYPEPARGPSPHSRDPLNPWAQEELFHTHPDRLYARTLVGIIRQGVRIGYKG